MTDNDHRAERAAREYFASQARGADFPPLDPASLAGKARHRVRWIAGGLAAACLVAAIVVVPLALRGAGPSQPLPAAPAPPQFAWSKTAPPPLSPRFDSLTGWIGDEFYIVGGWTGGRPCPPGAMCDMVPPDATDGATYDPAHDTWSAIAPAPAGFGLGYHTSAVAGDSLYVTNGEDLWEYNSTDDAWQQLADLPSGGQLVGVGARLFLNAWEQAPAGLAYEPGSDTWKPLVAGPLDECTDRHGLAADQRLLVTATCGETFTLSFYDPATGAWSDAQTPRDAIAGLSPVYAGGRLVWPDQLSVLSSTRLPGVYDLAAGRWTAVTATDPPGGLAFKGMLDSPSLVLPGAGLVAANGSLLDVRTAGWVTVPEAPVVQRWHPVAVAGSASLLSCYGYSYSGEDYQNGSYHDGCFLGRVAPAGSPTEPTGSPSTAPAPSSGTLPEPTSATSTASAGLAWVAAAPPLSPRTGVLLARAGDAYYLIGGHAGADQQMWDGARYDPASGEWTPIAALPGGDAHQAWNLSASVVGETIYVRVSFEEQGTLYAYETGTDSWRALGATDETESYLGTEDGLVRFRLGDAGNQSPPQLLADGAWVDLPASPLPPANSVRVFRLDDHHLGLESGGRVAALDTAARSWSGPSEPGDTAGDRVFGAAGAAVFVVTPDQETEALHNNKQGLEVVTYHNGEWATREPLLADGGLGGYTGAAAGRWALVAGNLLDPATGAWRQVPPMPGSDYQWDSNEVAAGPDGVLSCYPFSLDIGAEERHTIDGCYFLALP